VLSISTLGEGPELMGAAVRFGLGLEYSGFVDPHAQTRQRVEAFKSWGLRHLVSSMHGPFLDLMPGSMDEEIDAVARKRIRAAIGICEELEIGKIVFHTGWFPKTYGRELWVANSITFWKGILEEAGDREGPLLLIENVYEEEPSAMIELVDGIEDERVRACLDIGHVNANSRLEPRDWVEALGSRIAHVHIHNNRGIDDEHNGIFGGSMDIGAICELLDRHCPEATWNLEIKNDFERSIEAMLGFTR
jgi:sugar phosphate isomerase/epimerase